MSEATPPYAERIRACLLGSLTGDAAAVEDLLIAAECTAETGGLDDDALRHAGLGVLPPVGVAGIVLRTIPYGLLTPLDRPRLRRGAHACAALAKVDEGAVVTAVAAAVIAADLVRGFDIETVLVRCHQTLLEEAPMALLSRLRSLPDDAELTDDSDPTVALQLAVTALSRGHGVDACRALLSAESLKVAPVLAGALAGIRDGFDGFDAERAAADPLRERAERAASALASAGMDPGAVPAF